MSGVFHERSDNVPAGGAPSQLAGVKELLPSFAASELAAAAAPRVPVMTRVTPETTPAQSMARNDVPVLGAFQQVMARKKGKDPTTGFYPRTIEAVTANSIIGDLSPPHSPPRTNQASTSQASEIARAAMMRSTQPSHPPPAARPPPSAWPWKQILDPYTGKYSYWNAATNATQWEPPVELGGFPAAPAPQQPSAQSAQPCRWCFGQSVHTADCSDPAQVAARAAAQEKRRREEAEQVRLLHWA
jgi:hypothetical protein